MLTTLKNMKIDTSTTGLECCGRGFKGCDNVKRVIRIMWCFFFKITKYLGKHLQAQGWGKKACSTQHLHWFLHRILHMVILIHIHCYKYNVWSFRCEECEAYYVGKTTQTLDERIKNYRRDYTYLKTGRNKNRKKYSNSTFKRYEYQASRPVYKHFLSCGFNHMKFQVLGLASCLCSLDMMEGWGN